MAIVNCTPHTIRVICAESGAELEFHPSGFVARVATTESPKGQIVTKEGGVIPLVYKTFGEVEGLPLGWEDSRDIYVVSGMVASAMPGTPGIYAPDTGPTAVRKDGQVVAVTRLVAA